jgi:hypothetical protein
LFFAYFTLSKKHVGILAIRQRAQNHQQEDRKMTAAAFSTKHNLTATSEDVRRIRAQLTSLYSSIETIARPSDSYVQLYHGDAIRAEIASRSDLWGGFGAAMAMSEMPAHWPTKYRASVAYHLAPLLSDVVNS